MKKSFMKKYKGFTIPELIVVITVLGILSTIGFLSFVGYSQNARDTVRKSDIDSIETVAELYNIRNQEYPPVSEGFDVTYSGHPLWTQGVFGNETQRATGKVFGDLKDPRYGNQYAYSVTQSAKEYQLGVVYERTTIGRDDWRFTQNLIPETYADASDNPIVNLFSDNPGIASGMKFWYDAKDADADGIDDSSDSTVANLGIVSDAAPVSFTPFYFDRVIWLDAQDINGDGTAYIHDSDVDIWRNKTGGGDDAFVPTTGNNHSNPSYSSSPSYTATGFNGNPGVEFNGKSKGDRIVVDRGGQEKGKGFSLAYTFSIDDTANTSHATIISVGPTGGGQYFSIPGGWQLSRDGTHNNFIFRINGAIHDRTYYDSDGNIESGNDSDFCIACDNGEVAFGSWVEVNNDIPHTVFLTYEGNLVTGYLDGTKRFEAVLSSSTQPFGEYFRFFGNRAGTAYLEGILGEVFIASDRMSLQDIEKIEGYFARRWNWLDELPDEHPYKTTPPAMDPTSQLDYTRYSGTEEILDSFNSADFYSSNPTILNNLTVRFPGSMPDINIAEEEKIHVWRGPIKVSETGLYEFSLEANDYGFVLIDGNTIVNSNLSTTGTITLTAGETYDFEMVVGSIENSYNASLDFRVDGPGVVGYRKYTASGWYDKSINENDLAQNIPELEPSFHFGTQGFSFEPEKYFEFEEDTFSHNDDIELFIVWEAEDTGNVTDLDGYVFENSSGNSGSLQFGASGMRAGSNVIEDNTILGKQTQLSSFRLSPSGSGSLAYFVGGQNYSVGTTDVTSYDTPFYIGGRTEGFQGNIKEIIAYESNLDDSEREQIEGYLSHKWGIQNKLPGLHPYYEALDSDDESYVEVTGNYNGIFVHSNLADSHIVVASPSIMSSVSGSGNIDISTLIGENRFVFNGYRNVPAAYADSFEDGEKLVDQNGFFFDVAEPKIFEGSRYELANYNGILQVDESIRSIYTNSRIYENVSGYLEDQNSDYVKDILGNVIGINPITPFYCKDILEKSFGSNIGFAANISGSSGESVSGGIETLNDGETAIEGDYSYRTNPGDFPEIVLEWDDIYDISFIRIYNGFGDISQNLWSATMAVFDENDVQTYEYTFGNTLGVGSIDISLPQNVSNKGIRRIVITPVSDYDEIALREIEVFIGQNLTSGIYKVDSDGVGGQASYNVYCDMVTDGGGWTKVGENFIDKGEFQGYTDPSQFSGYYATGDINNSSDNTIRSDITPPSDIPNAGVLRHIGDSSSYYELKFSDLPDIEFTSEIRLGAWVKGTSSSPFHYGITYEGDSETNFQAVSSNVLDPDIWRYETLRIPLTDTLDTFTWKIGRGIDASTGSGVDITGLSTELYYK